MRKLLPLILALTASKIAAADSFIIKNIKGYTINQGKLTEFQSIQFTNDTIDVLDPSIQGLSKETKVIDGKGAVMLPGLIDAHGHVLNYGKSLMSVNLMGSQSEQEAVKSRSNLREKQS